MEEHGTILKLFEFGELKAAVYAFQHLYTLILYAREFELNLLLMMSDFAVCAVLYRRLS